MESDNWKLEIGNQKLVIGNWKMEKGKQVNANWFWKMVIGIWQIEIGY